MSATLQLSCFYFYRYFGAIVPAGWEHKGSCSSAPHVGGDPGSETARLCARHARLRDPAAARRARAPQDEV